MARSRGRAGVDVVLEDGVEEDAPAGCVRLRRWRLAWPVGKGEQRASIEGDRGEEWRRQEGVSGGRVDGTGSMLALIEHWGTRSSI
jgi:hypothetical protein